MIRRLIILLLIVGCNPQIRKYFYENPIAEIKMEMCEDKCKVYEYDDKYIELTDDYEHPWCICMTKCMAFDMFMASYNDTTDSFTFIDSSYCSPTIINPIDSLKNKIRTQ